jgi:C4-dicarboxylate transporter DctQ subunit
MKILDHLEEWLITFLMGRQRRSSFCRSCIATSRDMSIPGLQDWLLSLNFGWAQELCIIMFVWMAKFGAAYGVRTGIHVGVDVLINRMTAACAPSSSFSVCSPARLFTGIVGTLGAHFVWENGFHYASIPCWLGRR